MNSFCLLPVPHPLAPSKQLRFWRPLRKHFYRLRRAKYFFLGETKQLNSTWDS